MHLTELSMSRRTMPKRLPLRSPKRSGLSHGRGSLTVMPRSVVFTLSSRSGDTRATVIIYDCTSAPRFSLFSLRVHPNHLSLNHLSLNYVVYLSLNHFGSLSITLLLLSLCFFLPPPSLYHCFFLPPLSITLFLSHSLPPFSFSLSLNNTSNLACDASTIFGASKSNVLCWNAQPIGNESTCSEMHKKNNNT